MNQFDPRNMFADATLLDHAAPPDLLSPGEQAALCAELFGNGFLLPGGEAEILRLAKPIPQAALSRVIVAGAGVAGPARVLAQRLGMQVTAYERLPPHSLPVPPADASPLHLVHWRPGDPLPRRMFHHALALTPLQDGAPEPVLASLVDALRPSGHVILVDYAATEGFDPHDPTVQDWMRREHRATPPPRAQELSRVLARLGIQIRTIEDIGPAQARLAVYDWRRLLAGLPQRPDAPRRQALLEEATCWASRARLLQQGQLRLVRWHAVCPAGPPA